MEGGARPQLFRGGSTGVWCQVCPSGSQEIKLHYARELNIYIELPSYALKRLHILILGIHIKSASLQKKNTYRNYRINTLIQ